MKETCNGAIPETGRSSKAATGFLVQEVNPKEINRTNKAQFGAHKIRSLKSFTLIDLYIHDKVIPTKI
jgi:hypothetical protein